MTTGDDPLVSVRYHLQHTTRIAEELYPRETSSPSQKRGHQRAVNVMVEVWARCPSQSPPFSHASSQIQRGIHVKGMAAAPTAVRLPCRLSWLGTVGDETPFPFFFFFLVVFFFSAVGHLEACIPEGPTV